jgi:hypothetical protein
MDRFGAVELAAEVDPARTVDLLEEDHRHAGFACSVQNSFCHGDSFGAARHYFNADLFGGNIVISPFLDIDDDQHCLTD